MSWRDKDWTLTFRAGDGNESSLLCVLQPLKNLGLLVEKVTQDTSQVEGPLLRATTKIAGLLLVSVFAVFPLLLCLLLFDAWTDGHASFFQGLLVWSFIAAVVSLLILSVWEAFFASRMFVTSLALATFSLAGFYFFASFFIDAYGLREFFDPTPKIILGILVACVLAFIPAGFSVYYLVISSRFPRL